MNLIIEGANTLNALYKFNLPAPLLISHPGSSISSAVDFNICLTSSFVKLPKDKINPAAADTKGAEAEVPLTVA